MDEERIDDVGPETSFISEVNTNGILTVLSFVILSQIFLLYFQKIITLIVHLLAGPGKEERLLDKEIASLKKSIQTISQVEEFAKHARIQRQINKLMKVKDSHLSKRNLQGLQIRIFAPICLYVIRAVLSSILVYFYWNTPMLRFSDNWLGPFHIIMSVPCGLEGAVGVIFMMFIIELILTQVKKTILNTAKPAT